MKEYEVAERSKKDGRIMDCHHFNTTDELISFFMGFINGVVSDDGYYYEILKMENLVKSSDENVHK